MSTDNNTANATTDDRTAPEHRIRNFGGYLCTVFRNRHDRNPKTGEVIEHFGGRRYVCKWYVKNEDGNKTFQSFWSKTEEPATPVAS